jgi:hypothetical protein
MSNTNTAAGRLGWKLAGFLAALAVLGASQPLFAGDGAQLVSVTVQPGAEVMPRMVFDQTWTFQNTGTTTWSPGHSGYTLNLLGKDSLAATPLSPTPYSSAFVTSSVIDSALSVPPGGRATFTMSFIAPEAAGTYTNTFQLNSASSIFFGPPVTVQITVPNAGSTNQFDRARAVAYANNYAGYVCSDGYFWTNGSGYTNAGPLAPVPTYVVGDDCAHFVSCCIGREAHLRGAGLPIPSRVPPTYGEPGAARLVNTVLIGGGYATEVASLSSMAPGDVIGWNWEGDTNIANLDHVTLYLGNGLLAAHATSHLDVSATTWYQSSTPGCVRHLVHIFDCPELGASRVGTKLVLSWGTNWTGYALYSATSLSPTASWSKMSGSPAKVGKSYMVTNSVTTGAAFYRLMLPGN